MDGSSCPISIISCRKKQDRGPRHEGSKLIQEFSFSLIMPLIQGISGGIFAPKIMTEIPQGKRALIEGRYLN